MARTFLPIPDLVRYFLCGRPAAELTIASTCQFLDLAGGRWSGEITRACDIPRRILPPLVAPATLAGPLRADLADHAGLANVQVAAVAGHDTASAVAALPCVDDDCLFVSCGSWSILGLVAPKPLRAAGAMQQGFINQQGLGSFFFNKNLQGLHHFETLRRDLGDLPYDTINRETLAARPFAGIVNMDCPTLFHSVEGVDRALVEFMRATGQGHRLSRGGMFRLLLEALAFSYRQTVESLCELTGRRFARLCAVGGGTQNEILCQFVADATGLTVLAGPAEATVMGNLAAQALACGNLDSPAQIRQLVRNSSVIRPHKPNSKNAESWRRHYDRYLNLVHRTQNLGT